MWRFVMERREVVYRLGGVDPDEGVDVYKLVPFLTRFDELVKEAVRESGYEGELHVRIRPFREGSFITEFLVEGGLVNLLTGPEVTAVANALGILGFCGVGAASLPKAVKAVRGRIGRFKSNGDGTYTYGEGTERVTVDERTHRVIQSPKVADLYSNVAVGPIAEFKGSVQQVVIYTRDPESDDDGMSSGSEFTGADARDYAAYSKCARLADELDFEESTSVTHGIWLRPVSGSYGGAERGYTFCYGQGDEAKCYKSVAMADEAFRERLESGTVRFTAGDLLKVDLEITQRVTKSGVMRATYRITKVVEYRPLKAPRQATFDEFLGDGADT